MNQFLQDMLGSADPFAREGANDNKGRDITVAKAVAQAIQKLDQGVLKDQPLVEAAVRQTVGSTLLGLGDITGAEVQVRKSLSLRRAHLPAGHAEIADSLNSLGVLLQTKGTLSEAEQVLREALTLRRKLYGEDSSEVAEAEATLSMVISGTPERVSLIQDAIRLSRKLDGARPLHTATYLMYLGTALLPEHRYSEAESSVRESLEIRRRILGEDHPAVAAGLTLLSSTLSSEGRYAEAEPVARQALNTYRKAFGGDRLRIATALQRLSEVLTGEGRLADAETLLAEQIAMLRRLVGDAPRVGVALQQWSKILRDEGKLDQAEARIQEAIAIFSKTGHSQQNLAVCLGTLARIRHDQGRLREAEALDRDSLGRLRRLLGDGHSFVAATADHLGEDLSAQGKLAEAEQLYREFLHVNRQKPGNEENVRTMLTGLAEVMLAQKRGADAEPLALEALHLSERTHASVWAAQVLLGSALVERAVFLEAEPLLLTSYRTISDDRTISAKSKRKVLQRVIGLYEAWDKAAPNAGKAAEAARWRTLLGPANNDLNQRPQF